MVEKEVRDVPHNVSVCTRGRIYLDLQNLKDGHDSVFHVERTISGTPDVFVPSKEKVVTGKFINFIDTKRKDEDGFFMVVLNYQILLSH